jgi:hypothetical protein
VTRHEIVPRPGTVRRERDGQPGDLGSPADHPLRAECMTCGRPVRRERYTIPAMPWRHVAPSSQITAMTAGELRGLADRVLAMREPRCAACGCALTGHSRRRLLCYARKRCGCPGWTPANPPTSGSYHTQPTTQPNEQET